MSTLPTPQPGSGEADEPLGRWHGAAPAWRGDRPRLIVLPFAAHDYDGYQALYARRLAEWLATRLHATDVVDAAFPVLLGANRGRPDYATLVRLPEPAQIQSLASEANAEWAVFGRLNLLEQIEWEIVLLQVATGELVYADQATHPPERPLEALSVVGLQILRAMGLPALDDDARSRLFGRATREPEALRSYLIAADLVAHPDRTAQDVTNALTYAFNALDRDAAFFPAADLVLNEVIGRLDGGEAEAQSALNLLRRLTTMAPAYHKVPATVGLVWQRGGNHAEAARAYREALRLSPSHPYYLFRLAVALDALDDPAALTTLEETLAADPANLAAQDLLGARLANQGRLDEAVALWQRQLAANPAHVPALTNLASAADQRGDEASAAEAYAAALALNDRYPPALDRFADLLTRQGQYHRAADLLERLVRLRPDDPVTLERLARALAQLNRPEQELATLNRLVALRPDYWPAHYTIAVRHRTLGRPNDAIAAYERVLNINPDHRPSLIDLGYLLGTRRRLTDAARLLAHAHALKADDPEAAYNYAVVQMERGDWLTAEQLLLTVKRLTPDDPMPDRVLTELARRRRRGY